jgi:hypothetical protein
MQAIFDKKPKIYLKNRQKYPGQGMTEVKEKRAEKL